MKIRLATLPKVPLFDHAGMKLTPRWSEVDTDKIGPDGCAAIETYVGQIIQVYPPDAALFEQLKAANAAARAKAAAKAAAAPGKPAPAAEVDAKKEQA